MVVVAVLRAGLAIALGLAGTVGFQSGLACHYDWAAIGGSMLMFAWAVRWLLSAATLLASAAAVPLQRVRELIYVIGLIAAALLFAGQSLSDPWWPFGWWPLVVSVLLGAAAVVSVRDFARAR